jgi:CheY-like chemotaxis protein
MKKIKTNQQVILVIESDKTHQYLLEQIFIKIDRYKLLFANNENEFDTYCKTVNFDLVIIELLFPCKNSFALIKQIKKQKNIPVIALTACTMDFERHKCFEYGCDDFISKPFQSKNLINKIDKYSILYRNLS